MPIDPIEFAQQYPTLAAQAIKDTLAAQSRAYTAARNVIDNAVQKEIADRIVAINGGDLTVQPLTDEDLDGISKAQAPVTVKLPSAKVTAEVSPAIAVPAQP